MEAKASKHASKCEPRRGGNCSGPRYTGHVSKSHHCGLHSRAHMLYYYYDKTRESAPLVSCPILQVVLFILALLALRARLGFRL